MLYGRFNRWPVSTQSVVKDTWERLPLGPDVGCNRNLLFSPDPGSLAVDWIQLGQLISTEFIQEGCCLALTWIPLQLTWFNWDNHSRGMLFSPNLDSVAFELIQLRWLIWTELIQEGCCLAPTCTWIEFKWIKGGGMLFRPDLNRTCLEPDEFVRCCLAPTWI